MRSACRAIALAVVLLSPHMGAAATHAAPRAPSPSVVRLRLELPLSRPEVQEQELGDTTHISVPDSMSVLQFVDSDRYFAHFPADRAATIDQHTRRLEFSITTPAATAEISVRIQGGWGPVFREFRARKLQGHDRVVVRWDLRDSTGVRLPPGGYNFVIEGRSGDQIGNTTGVIRVRP